MKILARVAGLLACVVASAHASNEAGKTFLKANAAAEGVVTLPSGLQYKIISSGDGKLHPLKSTDCTR